MAAFRPSNQPTAERHFGAATAVSFLGADLDGEALENEIIPGLLLNRQPGERIRAWVMGCGTGEVAYGIAMSLCEANLRLGTRHNITVFATDANPHVLGTARRGCYPKSAADGVPPDRMARWFRSTDSEFCVGTELRNSCIFTHHDLAQDMPFSRLDLIFCGGVIQGLPPAIRDRALPLLYFALRPAGCLVPRADECMSRHHEIFAPIEGAQGIYRRVEGTRRLLPTFPLSLDLREGSIDLPGTGTANDEDDPRQQVDRLQRELHATKAELRATIDQLRAANRKLQFSNEEYQALNQELRSTNDDLLNSKADLQSLNSELAAVNGELAHRIDDFRKANVDLRNFLESTRVSTMFLDKTLRLIRFTPALADIFRVTPSDIGRPITDLAGDLDYACFREDVQQVLRTLGTVERKVRVPDSGIRYLVRVMPYRDASDVIAGVVVTFLDVSALELAEEALQRADERFMTMAASVPAAFFIADAEMDWTYVNPRFYEFTGLRDGTALGSGWLTAVHPDDRSEIEQRLEQALLWRGVFEHELRLRDAAHGYRWYLLRAVANVAPDKITLTGWTGSLLDTHERRMAETRQRLLFGELQRRVKTILGTVRSVADCAKGSSTSVDDFFAHFDGRLGALARVQAAVARQPELDVDLEELISEELLSLAAGCEERIAVAGPAVRINEQLGQAIVLAIHELATNALKYGALSVSSGDVDLAWSIKDDRDGRLLHLEWNESTVPVLDTNPRRVGFGRVYLERRLPAELGAATRLEFRPGGIRCVIDCPLPNSQAGGGAP